MQEHFPKIGKIQQYLKKHPELIHASNLIKKAQDCIEEGYAQTKFDKLNLLIPKYLEYLKKQFEIERISQELLWDTASGERSELINKSIEKRVQLLNDYYLFFEQNKIEGKDGFDSRSKIRSTILEEFMYFLFNDIVSTLLTKYHLPKKQIKNGNVEAYSNLYFTGADVSSFIDSPTIELNTKQQDYAIYREVKLSIQNKNATSRIANIPILAIENKTFLDKTMLDGAVATAEKIKMGAPYAVYIVATETYAVKYEVDPVYSRIDQIFVLRKCKHNKKNRLPQEIKAEVVIDMFYYVLDRIKRPWANIEKKLAETGTII